MTRINDQIINLHVVHMYSSVVLNISSQAIMPGDDGAQVSSHAKAPSMNHEHGARDTEIVGPSSFFPLIGIILWTYTEVVSR